MIKLEWRQIFGMKFIGFIGNVNFIYILEESKIYESHNFEILLWKIVDILNNNRGRIMFCRNDVLYVKFLKKKEKKEKKENWLHSFQIVTE